MTNKKNKSRISNNKEGYDELGNVTRGKMRFPDSLNPDGANGLFFGNPGQLWTQFISVVATMVFAFVMTLIILKVIDLVIGLRITDEEETKGMDISLHNETGYGFY